MRLPNAKHQASTWRINEVAPDFRLEDAWALPARGGAGDFPLLIDVMTSLDPESGASGATRLLFKLRWQLGKWFGWDDDAKRKLPVPGKIETSLSARLPVDLRDTVTDADRRSPRFAPLYRTKDEWAAELSNQTVHAVLHLAWVEQADGRYQGQMGVYVKPRGRFGGLYMAAISPFRHLIVYPALMRLVRREWKTRMAERRATEGTEHSTDLKR